MNIMLVMIFLYQTVVLHELIFGLTDDCSHHVV